MKIKTHFIVLTALCCLLTCPLYAQQKISIDKNNSIDQSATLPSSKEAVQKILSSPEQIRIPENYGSIKEVWAPDIKKESGQQLVIHVQDAHCNYEAQSNIGQILNTVMKEYPDQVKLVAVEGSVGLIDTTPFAEFSDKEIKKEVADYFMKKGKITGPEFLSITGDQKFTIYGIENKELYDKNYKAFLDSLPFRDESEKYCGYLQDVLGKIKIHVYNEELKDFDKQLSSYHESGETSFLDYVDVLKKWAEKKNIKLDTYKNICLLQKAQEIEKGIDFNTVDKERTQLIDNLGSVLDKQGLSDLVLKSLHFRLGKLTAVEYYNYLNDVVEKSSSTVSGKDYPNLFAYIDYVRLHHEMDKTKLFDECNLVEDAVAESLFQDDNQKRLFTLSRHVGILRRMFKLELVKEDYKYYKDNKHDFMIQSFVSFAKIQAPRFGIEFYDDPNLSKIDQNLPTIEQFYEAAIERDPVLINNMTAEMQKLDANICVLVTGGFHTKGLTDILKEKQIAYAVVSPKITKKQEYNPYIDIMTNKKTPFEEFLEQLGEE